MKIRQATPADLPEIVRFVHSVLAETAAQKADVLDDSFYRWQYDLSRDLIVIAEEGGRILAHYPLVEYPLAWAGTTWRAGVCQDLSVDASLRGRGIFRDLGLFANELAIERGLDLLFSFPNHRSIPGFLKHHGYRLIGELGWYATAVQPAAALPWAPLQALARLLPLAPALRLIGRRPTAPTSAGPWKLDDLEPRLARSEIVRRPRTTEFVDWRFRQRPGTEYRGVVEDEDGQAAAWGAARVVEIKGIRVGVIMDLAMTHGATPALGRVLASLRGWLAEEDAALAIMVADPTLHATAELLRAGLVPLPKKLSPRHLNLVGRAFRPELEPLMRDPSRWSLSLADWDVF